MNLTLRLSDYLSGLTVSQGRLAGQAFRVLLVAAAVYVWRVQARRAIGCAECWAWQRQDGFVVRDRLRDS